MEQLNITYTTKTLTVQRSNINGSVFEMVMLSDTVFNDVNMAHVKITNANLSDLEIEGAQLGGAFIHNIGLPPKGHPAYNPTEQQRPLKFDDCYLAGTTITNCNLANVNIADCNITGMKINGLLLDDLLTAYRQLNK